MVLGEYSNLFLLNLHSNITPDWQAINNPTLMNDFVRFCSLLAPAAQRWPLVSSPARILTEP